MVSIMQLSNNIKNYLLSQIDIMSGSTPVVGFMKPLLVRALDKNISKVNNLVGLIADEDGNVDIENILSEMIDNISTIKPFSINTNFIGDIEIGGGEIKLNIPFINKRLVLNQPDLDVLKNMLTYKN